MKLNENDLKQLIHQTLLEVAGESERQDVIDFLVGTFEYLTGNGYNMPEKEAKSLLDGYRRMIEKYDFDTVKSLYSSRFGGSKKPTTTSKWSGDFFGGKDDNWFKKQQDGFDREMAKRKSLPKGPNESIMKEGSNIKNKLFLLNVDYLLNEYFKSSKSLIS